MSYVPSPEKTLHMPYENKRTLNRLYDSLTLTPVMQYLSDYTNKRGRYTIPSKIKKTPRKM